MSRSNYLQKIAIVGASGNVGASTIEHLLKENIYVQITIITRADSQATFPTDPRIIVKKGAYDDAAFLQSAFEGQDLAMFALSFGGTAQQPALIDAAVKAGVRWMVPNEYAADATNQAFFDAVPILAPKVAARQQIFDLAEKHKGLNWIGVVTNPWTELCVASGGWGINLRERSATLYSGLGHFNSSSISQVGLGIARLLSLPIQSTVAAPASLEDYANKFVFLSSYSVTQQEIFASVLRASNTTEADWKVEHASNPERIEVARAQLANGFNLGAIGQLLMAYYMGEGLGGDYQEKALADAKVLGLKEENLDEVVARVVKAQGA